MALAIAALLLVAVGFALAFMGAAGWGIFDETRKGFQRRKARRENPPTDYVPVTVNGRTIYQRRPKGP